MIVAVRHPPPAITAGTCYGQLDVPLAEPATFRVGAILDRLPIGHFDRVVSSPLTRARELAEVLAASLGAELDMEPRLMEMDFGSWEGVAWEDIARTEIDAWAADPLGYRTGGGETVSELARRVGDVWAEANAARQLWVTHAGPMRCLLARQRRLPLESCLRQTFDYCEALVLGPAP